MDWWIVALLALACLAIFLLMGRHGDGDAPSAGEPPGEPGKHPDCRECEDGWLREYRAGGAYSHRKCPRADECRSR